MKRTYITMAIGLMAASTAALAQTNVTLGGQVKLGLDHISVKGGSGADPSASRVTNNTSFWYLDGKEDLGNGKQAYYHLEWDFSADTGATAAISMWALVTRIWGVCNSAASPCTSATTGSLWIHTARLMRPPTQPTH